MKKSLLQPPPSHRLLIMIQYDILQSRPEFVLLDGRIRGQNWLSGLLKMQVKVVPMMAALREDDGNNFSRLANM